MIVYKKGIHVSISNRKENTELEFKYERMKFPREVP